MIQLGAGPFCTTLKMARKSPSHFYNFQFSILNLLKAVPALDWNIININSAEGIDE